MKNSKILLFLLFGALSFAQQPTNSGLNYKNSSDDLFMPNSPKLGLNMNSFKLEDFIKITNPISKLLEKSYIKALHPKDNMPIFMPEGKFYIETYEEDQDIDYKLKIFDLEKSKYFYRSMG